MLNGYRIIDADSHVFEPSQMWAKYLAPEFKQFAPFPERCKRFSGIILVVSTV